MSYLKNYRQAQARPHPALRQLAYLVGHRLIHHLTTCESDCESHEHQCGAQKHECRRLDEKASLDRRRDLESAIDPTVPKTLKRPDAPTESDPADHEITHFSPAPWCETCVLRLGIEPFTSDSLRWNATRGPPLPWISPCERPEPTMGESMTTWGHVWQSSTQKTCLLGSSSCVATTNPRSWRWHRK